MASVPDYEAHCAQPPPEPPVLRPGLPANRQRAIVQGRSKWVNGTELNYYFFDQDDDGATVTLANGRRQFVSWVGDEGQRDAVREAFVIWKGLGLGLNFREIAQRSEAEVRIGFMEGDGSWSYIGRDVLGEGSNERTMSFGWDLTTPYGRTTALHEIGHTLGLPHEHQNPFAGIRWDEAKVYQWFAGPPNRWSREETFRNVLQKLSPAEVEGSAWDPDSIMEYWFPGGLINEPARYKEGIDPPGTISPIDREWALRWYPAQQAARRPALVPFQSKPLKLAPAQQADFTLEPPATRRYEIATFGAADTVVVLFEEVDGKLRYLRGDDDSGEDRNAHLSVRLVRGRRYVLRLRLYWAGASGETAVMYW
jgi:hypothetical protein